MKTFEEKFCAAHRCTEQEFSRRIFWKCLHRHAVPVAPLILALHPRYFTAERELIGQIRRAEKMTDVWEEIRHYFMNPRYHLWLRSRANIRISARRLIELARDYLPSSGPPPAPPARG